MAISRSYPLLHIFGNTWSQLQETGDGFRQLWMTTEKPLLNNHFRICKGSSVKRLRFVLRRSGRVWRERSQNAWGLQWVLALLLSIDIISRLRSLKTQGSRAEK